MLIKVDNRERHLIPLLKYRISEEEVIVEKLDLGDIQIIDNEQNVFLIFERKTVPDLASSITDGRYHEQKSRLLDNYGRDRIVYVIEGPITKTKYVNPKPVNSSILHTIFRDRLRVIRTLNMDDTVDLLANIWERYKADPEKWNNFIKNESLTNEISVETKKLAKKIDNLTPKVVYINMLCQIPGVSNKVAESIAKEYPTLQSLLTEYQFHDEPKKMLENIFLESRRLGLSLSSKIYDYISGEI